MKATMIAGAFAALLCSHAHAAKWDYPVPEQGTWVNTLQPRDLDGDKVTDAFYDTVLNVTWLRNAGAITGTYTYTDWDTAVAKAAAYSIGKYADWRLPNYDGCLGFECANNEFGHLYYVTLGNTRATEELYDGDGVNRKNTGDFIGLGGPIYRYWTGKEASASDAFVMVWPNGYMTSTDKDAGGALLLADGDIARAVPEPVTYALMLAGLGLIAGVVARRVSSGAS